MMNAQQIDRLRKAAYADLAVPPHRKMAVAVLCMLHTGESLGTAQNATLGRYGVITWRQRHFSTHYTTKTVEIRYVGAKGAIQVKHVEDPELYRPLSVLLAHAKPHEPVLNVSADQVNNYLTNIVGCTARDVLKYVREVVLKTKKVPAAKTAAPKMTPGQRRKNQQRPAAQFFYQQTQANFSND